MSKDQVQEGTSLSQIKWVNLAIYSVQDGNKIFNFIWVSLAAYAAGNRNVQISKSQLR